MANFLDLVQGNALQPGAGVGAPQGDVGAMLNTDMGGILSKSPQTPQEVQMRKGQWQEVLANPNMKSALLRMGLQMMQGTRPGESALGATARAGIGAMDYFAAKQDIDRRNARDQQKLNLDTRNTESQIASRTAQTGLQVQEGQQNTAKFAEWQSQSDVRRRAAEAQYQNLLREGKLDDARLLEAKFKADEAKAKQDFLQANPGLREQSMRDELLQPTAELARTRAQTTASNASAGSANASAAKSRAETAALNEDTKNMPAWIRALPDKEAQLYAQTNKGTKTQTQIISDIGLGKHHGLIDKSTAAGGGDAIGYQGMAQSIVERYRNDPRGKRSGMSLDQYAAENYNVTLGKSAGTVLALAKQIEGSTAVPAGETVIRGKDGKLMIQK